MKNGFEVAARYRKVIAICNLIPQAQDQRAVELTAQWAEQLTAEQWATLAGAAGVKAPSAETVRVVVQMLRNRQPLAQHNRVAS